MHRERSFSRKTADVELVLLRSIDAKSDFLQYRAFATILFGAVMKSMILATIAFVFFGVFVQPLAAIDGGPDTLKLGEATIVKNGFGSRKKMFLSLYNGTLYLPEKSSDAKAIVAANKMMAVRIKITSKFVSQEKMIAALDDGFKASTGGNTNAIAKDIAKFKACFSDPIEMNDVFILAYVPDTGVVVYKNNENKGVVGGLEFKKAMVGIWISENPIDSGLKKAMLGK